jgi:hypothetical protein
MGMANTLPGLLVFAPMLGGWVLEHSSYPVLFVMTLIGVGAAAVAAFGLPPLAHKEEVEKVEVAT